MNVVGWPGGYAAIELPGMISAGGDTFTPSAGRPSRPHDIRGLRGRVAGGWVHTAATAASTSGQTADGGAGGVRCAAEDVAGLPDRFYGPTPSLYDHAWQLSDIERT